MRTTTLLAAALVAAFGGASAQTLDFQSGTYAPRFYVGAWDYRQDGFSLVADPNAYGSEPVDTFGDAWTHRPGEIESSSTSSPASAVILTRDDASAFRLLSFTGYTTAFDAFCNAPAFSQGNPGVVVGSLSGVERFRTLSTFECVASSMASAFSTFDIDRLTIRVSGLSFDHVSSIALASPAPEPETWALLAAGLLAVALRRRRA